MPDDIFRDDPRFGEEKKEEDEGFSKGMSDLGTGVKKIFLGLGRIFTRRIPMNLLFLFIIIALVFFGSTFFREPEITGQIVKETNISCPKPSCPETECTCPEINCYAQINCSAQLPLPAPVNIIYFKCPSGAIVNKSEECSKYPVNITSDTHAIASNSIISLDGMEIKVSEDENGAKLYTIRRMNVTIANLDTSPILPRVDIKIYKKWTADVAADFPLRSIKFDDSLDFNDVVSKSEPMILTVDELPKILRLELFDVLPDKPRSLAVVTKELTESTIS